MAHIMEELFEPYFADLGLFLPGKRGGCGPAGAVYAVNPDVGEGWYRVCPVGASCAISLSRLRLRRELSYHQRHPPFLFFGMLDGDMPDGSLGLYGGGGPGPRVAGYVGDAGESRMLLPKGHCVTSVGVTVTRAFCEDRIGRGGVCAGSERLSGFARLKRAVEAVGDSAWWPEMACAFQQLKSFGPARSAAEIFYEGKVMEIIAYVLQGGAGAREGASGPIPRDDAERLRRVERHLRAHPAEPGSLDSLAAMACMSRTKLLALFKRAHGRTITQYVQAVRMEQARRLLLLSDLKIEAVAAEVGYRRHGSFSEIFKRCVGVTPLQYRRCGSAGEPPA
ncbi:MAG: AraC family transcriptional regulator [Pseudodesulfovibrio sp.]